ncbi:MAG: low molecular weight protein arginine phosphatase [bacterium]
MKKKDTSQCPGGGKKILFVCTGNTCRSVMAAGIFKKLAEDFTVTSAGIAANPTYRIYGGLEEILKENGISYENHVSTPVSQDLMEEADVILVMEQRQRDYMTEKFSSFSDKVFLLTEFAGEAGDIFDPIGRPKSVYEMTFEKIKKLVEKIILKLKE